MKDRKVIIYQLLTVALLVALVCTVAAKKNCKEAEEVHKTSATPKTEAPADGWRKIAPAEIKDNAIELVDGYKGILAMGNKEEHNAMTIGWGTLGVLWRKPIFTVFVSTSRFSHSLMEKNDTFTVSFFNKSHYDDVMYLGHHSGRDGDKISKTKLHLTYTENGNPMFDDAFLVIECRKIYDAPFDYEKIDKECRKMYDGGKTGIHYEYAGEILNVFVNDDNR